MIQHGYKVGDLVITSSPNEDRGTGVVVRLIDDEWVSVRQSSTNTFPTNQVYHWRMLGLMPIAAPSRPEPCPTCGVVQYRKGEHLYLAVVPKVA